MTYLPRHSDGHGGAFGRRRTTASDFHVSLLLRSAEVAPSRSWSSVSSITTIVDHFRFQWTPYIHYANISSATASAPKAADGVDVDELDVGVVDALGHSLGARCDRVDAW